MKKTLLLIAAALISVSSFGQTVTNCGADGSNNNFKLPANSHVYAFFDMSDGLKQKLGIDDAHYTYVGADADEDRNLYQWNGGGVGESTGKDSFGEDGQYFQLVGGNGWSGWGLSVGKEKSIDLSTVFGSGSDDDLDNSGLYVAVKQSRRTGTPAIGITDGNGKEAKFELGTKGNQLNVPANGNWYSITISGFDLMDTYGVDFTSDANKTYRDKNLFYFTWGAAPADFAVDYAAFLYGPQPQTTGIKNIKTADKNQNSDAVYNISGQRVNEKNLVPGLYIKNGKKFIKK